MTTKLRLTQMFNGVKDSYNINPMLFLKKEYCHLIKSQVKKNLEENYIMKIGGFRSIEGGLDWLGTWKYFSRISLDRVKTSLNQSRLREIVVWTQEYEIDWDQYSLDQTCSSNRVHCPLVELSHNSLFKPKSLELSRPHLLDWSSTLKQHFIKIFSRVPNNHKLYMYYTLARAWP